MELRNVAGVQKWKWTIQVPQLTLDGFVTMHFRNASRWKPSLLLSLAATDWSCVATSCTWRISVSFNLVAISASIIWNHSPRIFSGEIGFRSGTSLNRGSNNFHHRSTDSELLITLLFTLLWAAAPQFQFWNSRRRPHSVYRSRWPPGANKSDR